MATTILRLPSVKTRTGLSRSTIYLRIAEGNFPKPIPLGPRAVGWLESDIDAWIEGQAKLLDELAQTAPKAVGEAAYAPANGSGKARKP